MENKIDVIDVQLRKLIRRIVKEELAQALEVQPKRNRNGEHPKRGRTTESEKAEVAQTNSIDASWAIFGPPQPEHSNSFPKQERPRALPGWTEPYRPEFEFEAPPFITNKPKGN